MTEWTWRACRGDERGNATVSAEIGFEEENWRWDWICAKVEEREGIIDTSDGSIPITSANTRSISSEELAKNRWSSSLTGTQQIESKTFNTNSFRTENIFGKEWARGTRGLEGEKGRWRKKGPKGLSKKEWKLAISWIICTMRCEERGWLDCSVSLMKDIQSCLSNAFWTLSERLIHSLDSIVGINRLEEIWGLTFCPKEEEEEEEFDC